MSESELLASSDFLAWCGAWERDRHCPLPMADWALENVGELAFDACVWAHEKEERRGFGLSEHIRTYPWLLDNGSWAWWEGFTWLSDADEVPMRTKNLSQRHLLHSFPAAIAYYLTHFDVELAKKYPPKRLAVPA